VHGLIEIQFSSEIQDRAVTLHYGDVEELHLRTGKVVRAADGVGDLEIFWFYWHIFYDIYRVLMHQICVVNGGIFPVLAGPAVTLGALLAMAAQSLITVCFTSADMTVFYLFIHKVAKNSLLFFYLK